MIVSVIRESQTTTNMHLQSEAERGVLEMFIMNKLLNDSQENITPNAFYYLVKN